MEDLLSGERATEKAKAEGGQRILRKTQHGFDPKVLPEESKLVIH